jgi:uncharacterized protein YdaU (DUF1376 family)
VIWYKFHIGEYLKETARLADAEDLAYRRLLDLCYMTEMPLPLDVGRLAQRIGLDEDVVAPVLREFFKKTDKGYINARAHKDIASRTARGEVNRIAGKLGGRPKKVV